MRSRSNGGVIGAYALPTQNYANGVFFIHDAAIYNTGANPIWPLGTGYITGISSTGSPIEGIAVDNSNYKTQTFTANGTFTVATGSAELEILIVGGGGPGGATFLSTGSSAAYGTGGGGGGGGVVVVRTFVNPGTTFTITLGQGGIFTTSGGALTTASNGSSTTVTSTAGHSYTALGGGRGGRALQTQPQAGASGGGSGTHATSGIATPLTYTPAASALQPSSSSGGYGHDGAPGSTTNPTNGIYYFLGGGGGGAGEAGFSGDSSFNTALRGYGGNGYLWSRTGYYYAPGGGGGKFVSFGTYNDVPQGGAVYNINTYNSYGSGAFRSSLGVSPGNAALANFGGGGGGSSYYQTSGGNGASGGAGGSGTVIFCYRYK